MELTFEMTVTVVVTNDAALLLAASARALGDYGLDTAYLADVTSSIPSQITELLMPEHAAAHIPGIDIVGSVCGPA
ncbi:hypothetical protein [Microbacterium sp. Mcb102]|uniref:hypothetical protein n=1 Tax=Microbacterium sp. Mcb102 TaxID=2926012 RepID=UPI0021C7AAD6|nr:hypothetical protein [Microbacterium sp. Mcb102]